jgi:23S rRNA (guanosine2251-2'-O)-methyltransferase
VSDVRNFGAISRSAHALGAHAIAVPSRGMAQINEDAMKSSAGALNHIPVCKSWNLKETLMYLKDAGLQLIGANEKAEAQVYEADFTVPTALIMGSEEDGISPAYMALLDSCVSIPQAGKVGSLNVGAATAICLYEISRQRNGG